MRTKTIEKTVEGIKFIFTLKSNPNKLLTKNHTSYRWYFGVKGDCIQHTTLNRKSILAELPYIIKSKRI